MNVPIDGEITLRHGALDLRLTPDIGGSIARFDHVEGGTRIPILRPAASGESSPLDMASFPLVPYCNRIRDGRFQFRGRGISLRPNMAGDPSPLHGQGWLSRWQVERQSGAEAVLAFRHDPGEWPWAYEARQRIRLDAAGLHLRLSCRNVSDEPMPCGLGQHPYFPCAADTVLDTRVGDVWIIDEHVLPVEREPAEGRYDLRQRKICGQDLDNGFSDWSGEAWIRTPGIPFAIRMASPDARFFQLYSPREGGLFVAEPVTHANAALNEPEEDWEASGLRILEPGEEMVLDARLEIVSEG